MPALVYWNTTYDQRGTLMKMLSNEKYTGEMVGTKGECAMQH